ncbi:hypothetical protein L208DRAFT_1080205, partial [Tricholoma matsutake]
YHPFLNAMVYWLMSWFYFGLNQKSVAELDHLVKEVILQEDFDVRDLKDFSASQELHRLDTMEDEAVFLGEAGWRESSVKIPLPVDKQK